MRLFSTVASQEKSHLHSCVLKVSLTPLMQLKKFPDILVYTLEEHGVSHSNSRRTRFFLLISKLGSFSLISRERILGIPVAPQEKAVSTSTLRGNPGVMPPFQKTPMSQSTSGTPDSHAMTEQSPSVSTHNTMARVISQWHLERKPLIPIST